MSLSSLCVEAFVVKKLLTGQSQVRSFVFFIPRMLVVCCKNRRVVYGHRVLLSRPSAAATT